MAQILFRTPRLLVREFEPADLDVFARLCANAEAMRWMGDGQTLSRETVERWITICQERYARRGYGTSAVIELASGEFVGFCGVVRDDNTDFDEIIYAFEPAVWGRGYATEVARAMLEYVFARAPALPAIYATINPANLASIAVVGKLGMEYQRTIREHDGALVAVYMLPRPAPSELR